jgi:cytidine deaminase
MTEVAVTAAIGPGHVVSGASVPGLLAATGLADVAALMQALLPAAQRLARPPISQFRVGAVGRAAETGDLILGANLEFPGGTTADTIHAEQFLFTRAHSLGATIDLLAVSARPCGHCRQFMNEFAGSERLTILDPEAGPLSLGDMLPWRFGPTDLGMAAVGPGRRRPLAFTDMPSADTDTLALLMAAGERAHTPYSDCPSAVALRLTDGTLLTGAAIENAAYNPGMPPLQAALITLVAQGRDYGEIETAVLGRVPGAAFDFTASSARLLSIIAPGALLETLSWQPRASS